MRVLSVACLNDNYAYLLEGALPGRCVIVDPSDDAVVQQALAAAHLQPVAILCTHHHFDHVGGVSGLKQKFPGLPVIAHERDRERIEGLTDTVKNGEHITFEGMLIRVLHIPGHTMGAVAYVVYDGERPWAVFTGDTLFAAGCGRLFEGTAADMHRSLNEILAALPDETLVFCGHEYTASNLRFAAHVEPANEAIAEKTRRVEALRAKLAPTVPSTMGEERATNPFLRVDAPAVRAFASLPPMATGAEVLAVVREAKDSFR